MPSPSKIKGTKYEREFCTSLSFIFKDSFIRSPNSGAYLGGKNITRVKSLTKNQVEIFDGDVICPPCLNNFSFELKFYDKTWSIISMFENRLFLNGWIDQVSKTSKPFWFLCFKLNNNGEFITFKKSMYPLIKIDNFFMNYGEYIISKLYFRDRVSSGDRFNFFKQNREYLTDLNKQHNLM